MSDLENERIYRMARLRELTNSEGWKILKSEIDGRISGGLLELGNLMDKTPEKLTGKMAFRLWARHKELSDLLDWIEDEVKLGETAKELVNGNPN